MPRRLGFLVLLLTLPLFADDAPRATLRMRNGSQVDLARPAVRGHIVEFREAPLAARGSRALASSYAGTFARFRRDLGEVRSGGPKASVDTRIRAEFYRVFNGVAVTLDEAELARVRSLPYVKAVYEDEPVEAFASEDTTRIARIGADRVWSEKKTRGAGVIVAVIDTGIDATHPALAGKVIGGFDFITHDDDPSDENGHGTHVAGIIAGEGAGVQGVAPDVKLLSYRVLDEEGKGDSSNIILALELAADPDRDNDFSDHVDVANLSLGSRNGSEDSPTSVAADHAVEAGVVVCLSAGNTPGGQTIGSPAASRLAITVGASDADDRITFWSSRGPAFPDLAIKPEISAPGNQIVSAKMGGGTLVLSGTSMAAPHVTGAAALVLALHPEWPPAQVKGALIATADAVADEVMARGGGRLNVYAATGNAIGIEPPALSFGNGTPGGWNRSRVVRVTNRGSETRTFTATATAANGSALIAEPLKFTLAPGASRDVALTVTVAPDAAAPPFTLSLGGLVSFRTSDGEARLPWVAVDAAKVHIGYDAPDSEVAMTWLCDNGSWAFPRYEGAERWLTLLPYHRCGFTVGSLVFHGEKGGDLSVLLETYDVTGDLQIQRSPADSRHDLALAGVDSEGALIQPASLFGTPYSATYSFGLPPDSLYAIDTAVTFSYHPLHVNTLDDTTITPSQVLFDFPRHRVIAVNHQPIRGGIHSDLTVTSLPSDLQHARVNVAPQGGRFRLQSSILSYSNGRIFGVMGGGDLPLETGWRGDVYVTAATSPDAWAAPGFGSGWMHVPDPETNFASEGVRWIDGRFVMSNEKVPAPGAYSVGPGETLRIGEAPLHPRSRVEANDAGFTVFPWLVGPAGEFMEAAAVGFAYELRDGSGTVIREGIAEAPYVSQAAPRGAYRATIRSRAGTELALAFDSTREDFDPPTLTSLRILGDDGAIATGVAPGEHATLAFTASDDVRSARLWWRTDGADWLPLPVPSGNPGYRVELPTTAFGSVDLRVELEDSSGNLATTTIDDGYSVGARRRATRR